MFLHVIEVAYLKDYQLRLTFDDGVIKEVDLRDELYGTVFEPLKVSSDNYNYTLMTIKNAH